MKKGVQKIYSQVASKYDLINRLMTFGLDVVWRRKAAAEAAVCQPTRILDLCCGTGDMARAISRHLPYARHIIGTDFSLPMLRLACEKPYPSKITFVLSDVGHLPFLDGTFDLLCIAFATRNLNSGPEALTNFLREFHRVLRPGGTLVHLETSQPRLKILRSLFHRYVRSVVRPLGGRLSGSSAGYRYLAHTVPRFYGTEDLSRLLNQAGFDGISARPLLFHVAALHTARRPGGPVGTACDGPN